MHVPVSPPPSVQDFHSLATYLSQNTSAMFLDTISDFHLLLFLVTNEVMPLQVGSECAVCRGLGTGHPLPLPLEQAANPLRPVLFDGE